MQTLNFILMCIGVFLFVYLVSWLLSLYMRAKPWEQPEPKDTGLLTFDQIKDKPGRPSLLNPPHETKRQIERKIRLRMGRK